MTVPPSDFNGDSQRPRRAEGWLIVLGGLILVALLGHLINQQRTSRGAPGTDEDEHPPRESPPSSVPQAPPSGPPDRTEAGNVTKPAAPLQAVYMVTHKHRLRDCHGTLTFTRKGLRFDSDEPEDSFAVGIDEVSIQDDGLRIRDKVWRFEFKDGIRGEPLFKDWKAGTLAPRLAP